MHSVLDPGLHMVTAEQSAGSGSKPSISNHIYKIFDFLETFLVQKYRGWFDVG